MKKIAVEKSEKFGVVLGIAEGGVAVYSCDYTSEKNTENSLHKDREYYRSYVDGKFMGYKWQCVELARRWLYTNRNYVFGDVPMAYDIFALESVDGTKDGKKYPLFSFGNGSKRRPEIGCMLIWDEGGEFEITGHVAIVTEVTDDYIRFIEQNVDNTIWAENQPYSRQLNVKLSKDGSYWIEPYYHKASILGWVIQTDDDSHSIKSEKANPYLLDLKLKELPSKKGLSENWVDTTTPEGTAYVEAMGHNLTSNKKEQFNYFCISELAAKELRRATNELHYLFMQATDYVLKNHDIYEKFNLPKAMRPKIIQSWENRRNEMVTGRFDFTMSSNGIKVYEYNADSASCYYECSRVQEAWAKNFGCNFGVSAGSNLYEKLVEAWQTLEIGSTLHVMQDHDKEENYHAAFMMSAIESSGIKTKIIRGTDGLNWSDSNVVDSEGIPIKNVWKTWAWETALDQIRSEIETKSFTLNTQDKPRIADVLLRTDVTVFEPLWTLITSNKALLPVLWKLFPEHPNLLNSQFELTEELKTSGYVAKPIVGRQGENISIVDKNSSLLHESNGRFLDKDTIYQELKPLPSFAGKNVQISTFTVEGAYAGACARVDTSLIIHGESDVYPLRVIPNRDI